MKFWGVFVAVGGVVAAWAPFQASKQVPPPAPWALVVSGDTSGYLSPCGCTSPMTGGIRRRATALSQLAKSYRPVLIDTGNFTEKLGRQSEMKAETMSQALGAMNATAVALTAQDANLGPGMLSSMSRLSNYRLTSTDLPGAAEGVQRFGEGGPFVIGSASPGLGEALHVRGESPEKAAEALAEEARMQSKISVLMLDDSLSAAQALAKRVPSLGVIVYRRVGWPPDTVEKEGKVLLVTPGERGKAIVRLSVSHGELGGYHVTRLGPEFSNDSTVDRMFQAYLKRVTREDLLGKLPKSPSDPYAGSSACAKCHTGAEKTWMASAHAHALTTLDRVGQGRDPDCVSCHVTALPFESGFRSRVETPDFAFVGCESCHGPGKAHSVDPKTVILPKIGKASCMPCHTSDQSPHFDFLTYWRKIAHK